jgi:uncharacterized protein YciI
MLWAVIATDKPNSAELRKQHLEGHKQYLAKHTGKIFFSGPLQTDDAGTALGSLWILQVADRAGAEEFVKNEVFVNAGVFESIIYRRMRQGHYHPENADVKPA